MVLEILSPKGVVEKISDGFPKKEAPWKKQVHFRGVKMTSVEKISVFWGWSKTPPWKKSVRFRGAKTPTWKKSMFF